MLFISCASGSSVADYVLLCVCVCVLLSVCVIDSCELNISKRYERILMKFFRGVGSGPETNLLDFGGDLITPSPI